MVPLNILKKNWGFTKENEEVFLYILKNDFLEVEVLNYGGIIRKILTKNKFGKFENIVLGFDSIDEYQENNIYCGAIVGRTSGRVKDCNFNLCGENFILECNNNSHNIHGGVSGFSHKIWTVSEIKTETEVGLKLFLESPHLEGGYPGKLYVTVNYTLKKEELKIEYEVITDRKTYVSLTNHSYFNLSGNLKDTIDSEALTLNSNLMVLIDKETFPTDFFNVDNSIFDFTNSKKLKEIFQSQEEQLKLANFGLDHPFVIIPSQDIPVSTLYDENSGRYMEVFSDNNCVVIYTGNYLGDIDHFYENRIGEKYLGICFETQDIPNLLSFKKSENKNIYPKFIYPNIEYKKFTKFKFFIK